MKIDDYGNWATLIRVGDYTVWKSGRGRQLGLDYSPDGGPAARIVGAAAFSEDKSIVLDEEEANELVKQFETPRRSEEELLNRLREYASGERRVRQKPLEERIIKLIQGCSGLEEGHWEGRITDFYFEFLATLGDKINFRVRETIKGLGETLRGVWYESETKLLHVDWEVVYQDRPKDFGLKV